MIGTSFGEWIFIRLCIVFLRFTPLLYFSLFLVSLILYEGETWASKAAVVSGALLVAEAIFYLLIYRPYQQRLQEPATHPKPLSRQERRDLFYRCFDNVASPEHYLQGWFLQANIEDIKRDNLKEFLLWAFFERADDESTKQDATVQEDLEEFIHHIEGRIERQFEQGRSSVKSLRLTLDGIETEYRSLLWYITVFVVDQLTHILLVWKGFQYYSATDEAVFPPRPQCALSGHRSPEPRMGYWYSPHRSADKLPVVFFHGIGVGLLVYIEYLAALLRTDAGADSDIGVIAIELLPISFRLTSPPPGKADFIEQMARILHHHEWKDFAISSHSYGSVLVTHLLSSPTLETRVRSIVLIDPVTPLLHLPDVAYNFTRRRPRGANEWQLYYFASKDPGVAHCLARHFFWRENIVWREQLLGIPEPGREVAERRVAVYLAGRDLISRPEMIAGYLTDRAGGKAAGEVKVIVFPNLDHAQVFDSAAERQQLVELTRSYCAPGDR